MFKFFRFLKNVCLLGRRLTANEVLQAEEKYSIKFTQEGPERYITYYEGDREANIIAEYSFLNDVTLFTDSFRKWQKPYGEELTEFDFQKVKNRVARYFACWGGAVVINETALPTLEDFIKGLQDAGIPYEEVGDGIIKYTADIDEERNRKGGFFNP
ncbi:MAG: hypothetical protein H7070_14525 [Saprospiraceae bacterium]|nr:hypothetical protein [Pyrinomonadaceae bacterium]